MYVFQASFRMVSRPASRISASLDSIPAVLQGLIGFMANPVLANGLAGLATSATAQATVEVFFSFLRTMPLSNAKINAETSASSAVPSQAACCLSKEHLILLGLTARAAG